MDPTNYGPHSPTRPFHPDPSIHAPPLDWAPHDHGHPPVQPSPWVPNHPGAPPPYHYQRLYPMGFDSHPMGMTANLSLPNPAPRAYPLPYPHPGPQMHPRPWNSNFLPGPASLPTPGQAPIPLNHPAMPPGQPRPPFGLQPSAARSGYPPQPPETELGGLGQRGTTLEAADAQPPRNIYASQYASPVPLPTPQQNTPAPPGRRPNYHVPQGTSSRVSRAPVSSPPFGTLPHHHELSGLPPYRRSTHSRARRSLGARLPAPDLSWDPEEDNPHDIHDHHMSGQVDYRSYTNQDTGLPTSRTAAAQMEILRSAASADKVAASKVALRLLQSVKIEDLPEKERTCVICYNDYGVETPEGINEAPLRLPKCKHVFGDHCIKRWFEESDSCPYCRDKLRTEPKHHFDTGASQAFMTMMRVRNQLPIGAPEEVYLRLMSNLVREEELAEAQMSERRSQRANGGDSGASTPEDENTASASSSTSASPVRIAPRDLARYPQWLPRVNQQRGAHPLLSQEREASRHRRRYSRGSLSAGAAGPATAEGDAAASNLSQPQALRPDGSAQSSTAVPNAEAGDAERVRGPADVEGQAAESSAAPVAHNRNRPW